MNSKARVFGTLWDWDFFQLYQIVYTFLEKYMDYLMFYSISGLLHVK